MSEAVLAPPSSSRAYLPSSCDRRTRLSSLEALERGFALFRSTFSREGWRYYVGAAPLVLCFIPMWVINGQIRISEGALFIEAALLAGSYILRVVFVGSYIRHVRERAFGTPTPKHAGIAAQFAAVGRLLTWKIMLSAGALSTLPSVAGPSWFYTACQFASLEAQDDGTERHSFTGCLGLASQWFGGSVLLFLMLFPLWTAVWLNGLILAIMVPQLLHSIFGVNTLLSTEMGVYALIQSSAFWLSSFAGAWLALDPIVKCTFVVVYQHLRSRREGDDLRGLLAGLPRERQKKAQMMAAGAVSSKMATGTLLILTAILGTFWLMTTAAAAQVTAARTITESSIDSAREARVQKMRQALDHESQRAIYRWHDSEHPSSPTWFDKLLTKIGNGIGRAWDALWNFLGKLWPRGLSLPAGKANGGGWNLKDLRLWITLIAVLTLVAGGVLFWLRRKNETASISVPLEVAPMPDLSDTAAAIERSEDEWFALASRLQGEGELRFSLRAAYFGLLSGLAQREWLTIRRDRTNREYLNEFTRRWRRRPQAAMEVRAEIPEKLRGSLRLFDGVWYGSHALTPEAVTIYRQSQLEFLNHV
jgi:Domain of unknown function (DUF4129)